MKIERLILPEDINVSIILITKHKKYEFYRGTWGEFINGRGMNKFSKALNVMSIHLHSDNFMLIKCKPGNCFT